MRSTGRHERVFHYYLVELIRKTLLAFKHIGYAEAEKRPLALMERRNRERVFAVGIIALRLDSAAVLKKLTPRKPAHMDAISVFCFVKLPFPAFNEHYALRIVRCKPAVRRPPERKRIRGHRVCSIGVMRPEPFAPVWGEFEHGA